MTYYETLGVSPEAEPAVISAAYKALVRIYHPDSYSGDKSYATQRLKEINAAWKVLSDPKLKQEYDKELRDTTQGGSKSGSNHSSADSGPTDSDFDDFSKAVEDDWEYAASFYSDLTSLYQNLNKIDRNLGFIFQAYVVDNKAYESRAKIASDLKREYLREKFGDDEEIQDLALRAINSGYREYAHDLNIALKRLGTSAVEVILGRLGEKYPKFSSSNYKEFGFGHLAPRQNHEEPQESGQAGESSRRDRNKQYRGHPQSQGGMSHQKSHENPDMNRQIVIVLGWLGALMVFVLAIIFSV